METEHRRAGGCRDGVWQAEGHGCEGVGGLSIGMGCGDSHAVAAIRKLAGRGEGGIEVVNHMASLCRRTKRKGVIPTGTTPCFF